MLQNLPMEGAGNGGSELPGSSDIGGQLVLAFRKIMTEDLQLMTPSTFDMLIVPGMDPILELVKEYVRARDTRMIDQLKHRVNQCFETWILTESERMLKDPIPTPDPKTMELRFSNKISLPILTGDEIKAEDKTCMEVSLHDSSTGNIVDVGPIASANVEIVALGQGTDDWTGEEFNERIARVEGKLPLLTVNECKLQGGKGVLENVKFRNHAAEVVKPSVFRLGARIVEKFDGIIVKEAKTESFEVKSYRNKYSQKNEIPYLENNIWVLKNIQRRGEIDKRLQAKGIDTVEKFLNHLLINPEELKNIVGLGGEKWKATVNHARKCESNKMYCYTNSQETLRVVFDIFGNLQGLHSEGQYTDTNMLSKNKKVDAEKLLSSAFMHWENVTPFDDLDSLQQHLAAIKTSFNPSNSGIPGQYPGITPEAGPSEMVDEPNNIQLPDLLLRQGIPISDTNSLARCDSFNIHDVEFVDGFHFSLGQLSSTMFTDSDVGCVVYGARKGGTGSSSAGSEDFGTGSASAGSEDFVPGCEPRRKRKLSMRMRRIRLSIGVLDYVLNVRNGPAMRSLNLFDSKTSSLMW